VLLGKDTSADRTDHTFVRESSRELKVEMLM
jgi:hypothetical protein